MTNTQPAQASDEPMRAAFEMAMRKYLQSNRSYPITDEELAEHLKRSEFDPETYTRHPGEWRGWKLCCQNSPQPPVIPTAGAVDDAKDAARYRWLCEKFSVTKLPCAIERIIEGTYVADGKDSIDSTIDAAISAQQGPEGKR